MVSRIERLEVHGARLVIPLSDFDDIPRRLGCSLKRSADELVLADSQPACELRFDLDGELAVLCAIEVRDDQEGHFVRRVLGPLLKQYQGDLDADLLWSPPRKGEQNLLVLGGDSTHRLLRRVGSSPQPTQAEPIDVDRLEALLQEGRAAWAEYQQLRRRAPETSRTKA